MTLLYKQTLGQDTALGLTLVCVGSKNNTAVTDVAINVKLDTVSQSVFARQVSLFYDEELELRDAGISRSNSYWRSVYVRVSVALAFLALGLSGGQNACLPCSVMRNQRKQIHSSELVWASIAAMSGKLASVPLCIRISSVFPGS